MIAQAATKQSTSHESIKRSTARFSPDNPPPSWQWDSRGWGFLGSVDDRGVYGPEYFAKYEGYAATDQGRLITRLRQEFVARHAGDVAPLLDVGIGAGQFVEAMNEAGTRCDGTDINPAGVHWLRRRGWDRRPWTVYPVVTFWDSMEHIRNLREAMRQLLARHVFVSMPIYRDEEEVFSSKHFRPDEHYWYFTESGLIAFLGEYGYHCDAVSNFEVAQCGREDILTFAFSREG